MGEINALSVALIALGLSATWVVLFYGFTRSTRYEIQRTQMQRVRRQVMRVLAEHSD